MYRKGLKTVVACALLFVMFFSCMPFSVHASELTSDTNANNVEVLLSTRTSLSRVVVPNKFSDSDGVGNAEVHFDLPSYAGFTKKLMVVTTPLNSTASTTGSIVIYVVNPDGSSREVFTMNPRDSVTKTYTLPSSGRYTLLIQSTCNSNVEVAVGWLD